MFDNAIIVSIQLVREVLEATPHTFASGGTSPEILFISPPGKLHCCDVYKPFWNLINKE